MPIVQHCTPFSYSLLPAYPLLSAPPVQLMLPAPRVSGLLAAPKPVIVVEKHHWVDDILEELGPFKSIEELDAELMPYVDRINERMAAHRARWAKSTQEPLQ